MRMSQRLLSSPRKTNQQGIGNTQYVVNASGYHSLITPENEKLHSFEGEVWGKIETDEPEEVI